MTSEVVVMNRGAVALAADSASTVEIGRTKNKVWNSANKLFALSKHEPVGIMIYNQASILGVPWETVVKMYRSKLADDRFSSIPEYGADLISYLTQHPTLFPEDVQDSHFMSLVRAIFRSMESDIRDVVIDRLMEVEDIDATTIQDRRSETAKTIIESTSSEWAKADDLACFAADHHEAVRNRFDASIDEIADEVFHLYNLDDESKELLRELAAHFVTKDRFEEYYTGIVIAGFGESEHFPALQSFKLGGVVLGKLKYKVDAAEHADDENPALVRPFAQSGMVDTFLEGINPSYRFTLVRSVATLALELPAAVIEELPGLDDVQRAELKAQVAPKAEEALRVMIEKLSEHRRKHHWGPVHQALVNLPKDELAHVAESLVNLNSFQKRVSMDAETVGGPIDVAVITKGDGFVWIRRKHYFPPELNEAFFRNYYRSGRPVNGREPHG